MIFFEAPHRAAATLSGEAVAFGADRRGAVCRELTRPMRKSAGVAARACGVGGVHVRER